MVGLMLQCNQFGLPKFCCELGNFLRARRTFRVEVILVRNCTDGVQCPHCIAIVGNA